MYSLKRRRCRGLLWPLRELLHRSRPARALRHQLLSLLLKRCEMYRISKHGSAILESRMSFILVSAPEVDQKIALILLTGRRLRFNPSPHGVDQDMNLWAS